MLYFAIDTDPAPGSGLGDFAFLDATGADPDPLGLAVHQRLDRLQIYAPAPPRDVVGVRDIVAELRAFPADITYLCHDLAPNSGDLRQRVPLYRQASGNWANLHYTRNRRR